MAEFHRLVVKEVKKETAHAVSITFDVPEKLKNDYKYEAGQYVTIKKTIDGKEIRRAYSICEDPHTGILKVVVKAVDGGVFSTYATKLIHKGDKIRVSTPEGRFIHHPEDQKNYIAFAAGSGITPIMAMMKATIHPDATFTLIYGNRTANEVIFKEELDVLKKLYANKFNVHYIYSREEEKDTLFGRIDTDNVNHFIKNTYKDVTFDEAFICGPERMIHDVTDALVTDGISKENVHFELFTVPVEKKEDNTLPVGNTEITVILDDEETTFIMPQSKFILNAALDKDLDPPYSCQGGICSSCICKVKEGEVVMQNNTILDEDELAEGLILSCQAHPITPKLIVDFDDV